MEEEMKKVEKLIERCKNCKFATCEQCEINWTEMQAIEHLILAYKKLEEENKALKNILGQYKLLTYSRFGKTFRVGDNVDDYIPKQAIRDKIEEYRKKRIELANGHFWENADNIN